ncbi:MAG: DUF167 family protein [Methylocella sp.]
MRMRAVPQDGEANALLIRLLARALRGPAGGVAIEAGARSERRRHSRMKSSPRKTIETG